MNKFHSENLETEVTDVSAKIAQRAVKLREEHPELPELGELATLVEGLATVIDYLFAKAKLSSARLAQLEASKPLSYKAAPLKGPPSR
jgi:hypothetical protein